MRNTLYYGSSNINFLVEYLPGLYSEILPFPTIEFYAIDPGYGILSLSSIDDLNLLQNFSNLIYVDIGSIYTLSAVSPTEVSGAYQFENNYLDLNGTNVLVGIIDTGIDYLNREFMLEDDTTRIVRLWDQTLGYDKENLIMGSIYSEADINNAINAKKQGLDPYSIVPSTDDIGHGTSMASIIGARGYNPAVKGIASDCKYSIVKLKQITNSYLNLVDLKDNVPKFNAIDIILALNYLREVSKELQLPLVICLPLSSNMGSHDGRSILEYYINKVSSQGGNVVVTSSGNEGNTHTHAEGFIEGVNLTEEIELNIGPQQNSLSLNLYVASPQTITLTIISPAGQVFNNLSFKFSTYELGNLGLPLNFIYENTKIYVKFLSPDTLTGDEKIVIWSNTMKKGIWKFLLTGNYDIRSKYDAWIFQKDLLDSDTKFLTSNSNTTLTLPGTS